MGTWRDGCSPITGSLRREVICYGLSCVWNFIVLQAMRLIPIMLRILRRLMGVCLCLSVILQFEVLRMKLSGSYLVIEGFEFDGLLISFIGLCLACALTQTSHERSPAFVGNTGQRSASN